MLALRARSENYLRQAEKENGPEQREELGSYLSRYSAAVSSLVAPRIQTPVAELSLKCWCLHAWTHPSPNLAEVKGQMVGVEYK